MLKQPLAAGPPDVSYQHLARIVLVEGQARHDGEPEVDGCGIGFPRRLDGP